MGEIESEAGGAQSGGGQPEFVIFDDIRINESMRRFWRELSAEHRDNAIDVTDASHRGADEGMGLLICG